jgi:hypothetical protein
MAAAAPTGNALTDAEADAASPPPIPAGRVAAGIEAAGGTGTAGQLSQSEIDALDNANQQIQQAASDCLWPPSGSVTVPIIPGVYSQSFQFPCLLTHSEARAVIAAGIIVGGLLIIQFGLTFFVVAEVTGLVTRTLGGGGGSAAAGAGAARAVPAEAVAV